MNRVRRFLDRALLKNSSRRGRRRGSSWVPLQLEGLEQRQLLSITPTALALAADDPIDCGVAVASEADAGDQVLPDLDTSGSQQPVFPAAVEATIDVGIHTLLPNTPGQLIPVHVVIGDGTPGTGGVTLNAQVGDGGPERVNVPVDPPLPPGEDGPEITHVELLDGGAFGPTIFGAVGNFGHFGTVGEIPQFFGQNTATITGAVPPNGLLAVLTIDTTGFFAGEGPWDLSLGDTLSGSTRLDDDTPEVNPVPLVITDGLVKFDDPPGVAGTKFNDLDGDGEKDGNESGLEGWEIYLDLNGNGAQDAGEPSALTDENGEYYIEADDGQYVVAEVPQGSWVQTFPVGGTHQVTIVDSGLVEDINFGNRLPAGIHGEKFNDLDGDGEKDGNEPGLAGWQIYLDLNENDALDDGEPVEVTGPDGSYSFTVAPGTYVVAEVQQAGWEQTFPSGGGIGPANPGTPAPGAGIISYDPNTGEFKISVNQVMSWNLNSPGLFDGPGLPGVLDILPRGNPFNLVSANPNTVGEGLPGAPLFSYDNVYLGQLTQPGADPGLLELQTATEFGAEPTIGQIIVSTGGGEPVTTHTVTVGQGEVIADVDFGNHTEGAIVGTKFDDQDGDGVFDANESGLEGWTIFLDDGDGTLEAGEVSTTTDANGVYAFTGLVPGTYTVAEVQDPDWLQTAPAGGVHVVDVLPGGVADEVDFGNQGRPGAIEGIKFLDENRSGVQDAGEPGLEGWQIFLDEDGDGNLDAGEPVQLTDAQGNYRFDGLTPGDYTVAEVIPLAAPPWFAITPSSVDVTVAPNTTVEVDFGNLQIDGFSITGVKWLDANGNGEQDAGEPGLPGWTIYLDENDNGALDAGEPTQVTDENGAYRFIGLPPDTYYVGEVEQANWTQTHPLRSGGSNDPVDPGPTDPGTAKAVYNALSGEWKVSVNGLMSWSFVSLGLFRPDVRDVVLAAGDLPSAPFGTFLSANSNTVGEASFGLPLAYTNTSVGNIVDPALTPEEALALIDAPGVPPDQQTIRLEYAVTLGTGLRYGDIEIVAGTFVKTHEVVIEAEDVVGVDFGNNPDRGSIQGMKFEDLDGDGVKDPGEPGLAEWTIFIDTNGDGLLDGGETSTTTGPNGEYAFTGLLPGTYTIAEQGQDRWVQTAPAGGVYEVTLDAGEIVSGKNFGNTPGPGSISGVKFFDVDQDGVKDNGEQLLPGWTIYLDENNNGELDAGERTTVTEPDGTYEFLNLSPGTYYVGEVNQANWEQTFPIGGTHQVAVVSGEDTGNIDFGNWVDVATISGTKFNDVNQNGQRDGGEAGLPGWTIFLDSDGDGVLDVGEPSTITDPNGNYSFGVDAGTYNVAEEAQANWHQTAPANGKHVVTVTLGQQVTGKDFGNWGDPGSISGVKFFDANRNTQPDAGELPLSGWTIFVDLDGDGVLDAGEPSDVTDAQGAYSIGGLAPGNYTVAEDGLQQPWVQTFPAGGAHQVTVVAGQDTGGVNFGNWAPPASISGVKFDDLDQDGHRDGGEPGLAGWTIFIDGNGNSLLDAGEQSTITGSDGSYTFSGLEPGTYTVAEEIKPHWSQTAPVGGTHVVTVGWGDNAIDKDFGNVPDPAAITGTKYNDLDRDGVFDVGEPGLAGWTIFLDTNGNGVADAGEATATTDVNGNYSFAGLRFGTYTVAEQREAGWLPTAPMSVTVTVAAGETLADVDFFNREIDPNEGIIEGVKWEDVDGDGVRDDGEPLLEGWTIYLDENDNGQFDQGERTEVTDQNGAYSFLGLTPGTYYVGEIEQAGWEQTAPKRTGDAGPVDPGSVPPGVARASYDSASGEWQVSVNGLMTWNFVSLSLFRPDVRSVVLAAGDLPSMPFGTFLSANQNTVGEASFGMPLTYENVLVGSITDPPLTTEEAIELTNAPGVAPEDQLIRLEYAVTLGADLQYGEILIGGGETFYTAEVVLGAGELVSDIDFGNVRTGGSIEGTKFSDLDNDGVWDNGEPGLPGWTIFIDANSNGTLDDGELSTRTGSDGSYGFYGLDEGTYRLAEVLQPEWEQTYPAGGVHVVDLDDEENVTDKNFGNYTELPPEPGGITGIKFNDRNANGVQDVGELGLEGWTIFLDSDADGTLDVGEVSTTTAADGSYAFPDLAPNVTYTVAEVLQQGWEQTAPPSGSHAVLVPEATVVTGKNFGNHALQAEIHGTKFEDIDGNGVQDAGEPGLAGWTIFIDSGPNPNGVLDAGEISAVTDANGDYVLQIEDAGTYVVDEVLQQGWIRTAPASGVYVITLAEGEIVTGKDFGNQPLPGTIEGVKWHDVNGDGVMDDGEQPLAGWTIYLDLNENEEPDAGEPTRITGPEGSYAFTGLYPGSYAVGEIEQDGWQQTYPVVGSNEPIQPAPADPGTARATYAPETGELLVSVNGVMSWNFVSFGLFTGPDVSNIGDILPIGDPNNFVSDNINTVGESSFTSTMTYGPINLGALVDPHTPVGDFSLEYATELGGGNVLFGEILEVPLGRVRYTHEVTVGPGETVDGKDFGNKVRPAEIVDRHVFYNTSSFDGNNHEANAADDEAIATDKDALLPGGTATFANYTSYSRGINGIMVDMDHLAGTPTPADFETMVGNDDDPSGWAPGPAPIAVAVREDAGTDGSDRVTLIFADNAIEKEWVQVTVLATPNTGLEDPDVFYFGNAIGETGNSTEFAFVSVTDELGARNHPHIAFINPAEIDDRFDFDRNKSVTATDQIIARNNATHVFTDLNLITVPAAADAALAEVASAVDDLAWLNDLAADGATDGSGETGHATESAVDELLAAYWP